MRMSVLKPFAALVGLSLLTTACATGRGGKKDLAYVARDVNSLSTSTYSFAGANLSRDSDGSRAPQGR